MVIAVIEMSQSKWLVAAVIPGIERQPLKKIDPVGRTKLVAPGMRSSASSSPMWLAAPASGWLAGCRHAGSRPT
jgi:hypothetical protein